jgi:hypothetical protein
MVAYQLFIASEYATHQYFWSCQNPTLLTALGVSSWTVHQMLAELKDRKSLKKTKVWRNGTKKVADEIPDFHLLSPAEQKKLNKRKMNIFSFYTKSEKQKPAFTKADGKRLANAFCVLKNREEIGTLHDNFKVYGKAGIPTVPVKFTKDKNEKNPNKFGKKPFYCNDAGETYKGIKQEVYTKMSWNGKERAIKAIMDRDNDYVDDKSYIGGNGIILRKDMIVVDCDDWQTREDFWCTTKHHGIKTAVVGTPRGGNHFYFTGNFHVGQEFDRYTYLYKKHIQLNRGKSARIPQLDILKQGKMVTAAGSLTFGNSYIVKNWYIPHELHVGDVAELYGRLGVCDTSAKAINFPALQDKAIIKRIKESGTEDEREKVAKYEAANLVGIGDLAKTLRKARNPIISEEKSLLGYINHFCGTSITHDRHDTANKRAHWCGENDISAETFKNTIQQMCSPPLSDYQIDYMTRRHISK